MQFHVITLFPEVFDSYLNESIIGRAIDQRLISVSFYNPRKYAPKELKKKWPDGNVTVYADGRPFGGGPGMVLRAEPFLYAIEKCLVDIQKKFEKESAKAEKTKSSKGKAAGIKTIKPKVKVIFFSPAGEKFTTGLARGYMDKKYTDIVFICGRYEGIDARVQKIFKADEVSIGDYVLTGGELPAMICIDCMSRQVAGVLGNFDSREEERVSSSDVYTRPEVFAWKGKKYKVPEVLLSGNPKLIDEWKRQGGKSAS